MMRRHDIAAKALSIAVLLAGMLMALAWMVDMPVVRSVREEWISIKFTTSVCFVATGISLFSLIEHRKGRTQPAQIALSACSLVMMLIMATLLVSFFFGIRTGIEDFFIAEAFGAPSTPVLGSPALMTMVGFLLMVAANILALVKARVLREQLISIGCAVGSIGGVAILGYASGMPLLYYSIPGLGNPMALPTAVLFAFTGAALILIGTDGKEASA